jgi:hypothetical protein
MKNTIDRNNINNTNIMKYNTTDNRKRTYYSRTGYILRKTRAIAGERLAFRGGERLGDISIAIEDGATVRKVRRIVEKRVAQDCWRNLSSSRRMLGRERGSEMGRTRYAVTHNTYNTFRNIYGRAPQGYSYYSMRAA